MNKRQMPGVMWVALVVLAIMVVGKLVAIAALGPVVLIDAVLSAALLLGLSRGHRWAYVVTIVVVAVKVIAGLVTLNSGFALVVFGIDCLVLVPVLLSTDWFWNQGARAAAQPSRAEDAAPVPRVCPCCQRSLDDVASFCPTCGSEL